MMLHGQLDYSILTNLFEWIDQRHEITSECMLERDCWQLCGEIKQILGKDNGNWRMSKGKKLKLTAITDNGGWFIQRISNSEGTKANFSTTIKDGNEILSTNKKLIMKRWTGFNEAHSFSSSQSSEFLWTACTQLLIPDMLRMLLPHSIESEPNRRLQINKSPSSEEM